MLIINNEHYNPSVNPELFMSEAVISTCISDISLLAYSETVYSDAENVITRFVALNENGFPYFYEVV